MIVTREVLELYEKYHRDFGLLYERWADENDREKLTDEQMFIFGQFINSLGWLKVENISKELRISFEARIKELEKLINPEVAQIVKERVRQATDGFY